MISQLLVAKHINEIAYTERTGQLDGREYVFLFDLSVARVRDVGRVVLQANGIHTNDLPDVGAFTIACDRDAAIKILAMFGITLFPWREDAKWNYNFPLLVLTSNGMTPHMFSRPGIPVREDGDPLEQPNM